MSKFPEIPENLLQALWNQIRPVVKGPDGTLWYIREDEIDLRRTVFTRGVRFLAPAGRLEVLTTVKIAIPLLPRAPRPAPTIAEIFAQLVLPILSDPSYLRSKISRIGALYVDPDEFEIDVKNNWMIIQVNLFKGANAA